jgi:hypothetical protein
MDGAIPLAGWDDTNRLPGSQQSQAIRTPIGRIVYANVIRPACESYQGTFDERFTVAE